MWSIMLTYFWPQQWIEIIWLKNEYLFKFTLKSTSFYRCLVFPGKVDFYLALYFGNSSEWSFFLFFLNTLLMWKMRKDHLSLTPVGVTPAHSSLMFNISFIHTHTHPQNPFLTPPSFIPSFISPLLAFCVFAFISVCQSFTFFCSFLTFYLFYFYVLHLRRKSSESGLCCVFVQSSVVWAGTHSSSDKCIFHSCVHRDLSFSFLFFPPLSFHCRTEAPGGAAVPSKQI